MKKEDYLRENYLSEQEHKTMISIKDANRFIRVAMRETAKEIKRCIENLPSYKQFKNKPLDVVFISELETVFKNHLE